MNAGLSEGAPEADHLDTSQTVDTNGTDKPRRRRRRGSSGRSGASESTETSSAQASIDITEEAGSGLTPSNAASAEGGLPAAQKQASQPDLQSITAPAVPQPASAEIVLPEQALVPAASPQSPTPSPDRLEESVVTAAPAKPVDLSKELQAAGLEWVQTDPSKAPTEQPAPIAPILGRKPRRSEAVSAPEELVMVETRNHE